MDFVNFFFPQKNASQYLLINENNISIYKKTMNQKPEIIDGLTIEEISSIQNRLLRTATTVLLNSNHFIFHILTIEQRPLSAKKLSLQLNWLLEKNFPEKLSLYEKCFLPLRRKSFLSVLIKKETIATLEENFRKMAIPLVAISSLIIEALNYAGRKIDLIIEGGTTYALLSFLRKGTPIYFRKFRISDENEICEEILKTANFLQSQNSYNLQTFLLINQKTGQTISHTLVEQGLKPAEPKKMPFYLRQQ